LPVAALAYVSPGKPTGFVNDYVGVLSVQDKLVLEEKLSNFSKTYGNEISVVVIKDLGGDYIENYSVKLFEEWGIGKQGKDNGALVLVAMDDRQMRIEVGYGLEEFLTDAQSNWIINNVMKPAFQAGDYYGGISGAVDKIISVTQGEVLPSDSQSGPNMSFDWFYIVVVGFMILASMLGQSKSWWAGGVLGGVVGMIIGFVKGFLYFGVFSIITLIPLGLLFDFLVSRSHAKHKALGTVPWWMHRGGGHGGGGFGGFGGGRSGGGGASGRW